MMNKLLLTVCVALALTACDRVAAPSPPPQSSEASTAPTASPTTAPEPSSTPPQVTSTPTTEPTSSSVPQVTPSASTPTTPTGTTLEPVPTAPGSRCAKPIVCSTADSSVQLKITKPGIYDGQGYKVPSILIQSSDVTVQNFKVDGGTQAGIWSDGARNIIRKNTISNIGYGRDDVDGIRFFGDDTQIVGNIVKSLIRGNIRGAHPDCIQTYAKSKPGSSRVKIIGNWCLSPTPDERRAGMPDFHQCLMAEGPGSTDYGSSGGARLGKSEDWVFSDNTCQGTSNQSVAFRDVKRVDVFRNLFQGTNNKAIQSTDGSVVNAPTRGADVNTLGPRVKTLIGD